MSPLRRLIHRFPRRLGKHPTGEQAADALAQSHCLYSPLSTCSGGIGSVGLADNEDADAVLVCRAHFGRLRSLDRRQLEQLRHHLHVHFAPRSATATPSDDEGARLVHVRR